MPSEYKSSRENVQVKWGDWHVTAGRVVLERVEAPTQRSPKKV
jgi:hypothetical protein